MRTFLEDLGRRIGETAETVTNKAGEAVEVQRLRNQIRNLERGNERDYIELGRLVYDHYKKGKAVAPESAIICDAIANRKESIDQFEQQIFEVRGDVECEGCGRSVSRDMAYCPYCGAKIVEGAKKEGDTVDEAAAADQAKERAADTMGGTENTADAVWEKAEEMADTAGEKAADMAESVWENTADAADTVWEKAGDMADTVKEKAGDMADTVKEKAGDMADTVKEKAGGMADTMKEKTGNMADTVKEKTGGMADSVKEKTEDMADTVKEKTAGMTDTVRGRSADMADTVKERTVDMAGTVKERTAYMADAVREKAEEVGEKAGKKIRRMMKD